jgi:Protein of unknown function (DUF1592)/Protein of unknown function (DUF1588)/Protein of unknown function (DUF1595)/Protein of unknown function (DUF1585)/Protein of unknown function (DUF1587)
VVASNLELVSRVSVNQTNVRPSKKPPRSSVLVVALALAAGASACDGHVVGQLPDNATTPGLGGGETTPPAQEPAGMAPITSLPSASACRSNSPGPRALRRLSAAEYAATLKDLFGDANVPLTSVFSDPTVLGFSVDSHALVVQGLGAQQLMDQAESVAHFAVANHLSTLSSCTSMDANCRQTFIRQFGLRAQRAPLTDADVAAYDKLFSAEASFAEGAEAVVSAMLQSPYFLYRRELGTSAGSAYQLSGYELASALSYLLTGSMPDAELFAAAESGALSQTAELEKQAERLLTSPAGHRAVGSFMNGWLGLSKLQTVAKDDAVFKLNDSLRQAMAEETRALIESTIFEQNGSVASLLTTHSSFVNRELGTHYGLGNAGSLSDSFTPVTFAPTERDGGLLAQGSFLTAFATASESSPVQRGKMVRTRLLCQDLPPPPANLDTVLKPAAGGTTTREHFSQHSTNPVCASCHRMMDPIGFGFEHYDAFGRRREQENGKPIDATGRIVFDTGGEQAFDGLPGLVDYLTTQAKDQVNACVVRYWSYFAFGAAGWDEDQCTYDAIAEQAKQDGFALKAVAKAIVKTARFSRRVADP